MCFGGLVVRERWWWWSAWAGCSPCAVLDRAYTANPEALDPGLDTLDLTPAKGQQGPTHSQPGPEG